MQNFANYTHTASTALLLIGSPGSGKSTSALRFPNPYVFDADRNLSGPMRFRQKNDLNVANIKFDYGDRKEDGTKVTPFYRWSHMASCLKNAAADPEVKTIILDSLTSIQEMVKDDIFRQRVGPQKIRGGSTITITEQNRELAQLTEPEWGVYGRYWNTLITTLKSTGKLIIVTAHDETRQNETNGIWEHTLSLQGQQRYKFAGLFSDVIQCYVKLDGVPPNQTKKFMYKTCPLGEHDKRGIKDSFQLPAEFEDFDKLLEQLSSNQTEVTTQQST